MFMKTKKTGKHSGFTERECKLVCDSRQSVSAWFISAQIKHACSVGDLAGRNPDTDTHDRDAGHDDPNHCAAAVTNFVSLHRRGDYEVWLRLPSSLASSPEDILDKKPLGALRSSSGSQHTHQQLMHVLYCNASNSMGHASNFKGFAATAGLPHCQPDLLSVLDIYHCSMLLLLKMVVIEEPLGGISTSMFSRACGSLTAQLNAVELMDVVNTSQPIQTKLAVATLQGLVAQGKLQGTDDFSTCLCFMASVTALCPAKQAIAEALVTQDGVGVLASMLLAGSSTAERAFQMLQWLLTGHNLLAATRTLCFKLVIEAEGIQLISKLLSSHIVAHSSDMPDTATGSPKSHTASQLHTQASTDTDNNLTTAIMDVLAQLMLFKLRTKGMLADKTIQSILCSRPPASDKAQSDSKQRATASRNSDSKQQSPNSKQPTGSDTSSNLGASADNPALSGLLGEIIHDLAFLRPEDPCDPARSTKLVTQVLQQIAQDGSTDSILKTPGALGKRVTDMLQAATDRSQENGTAPTEILGELLQSCAVIKYGSVKPREARSSVKPAAGVSEPAAHTQHSGSAPSKFSEQADPSVIQGLASDLDEDISAWPQPTRAELSEVDETARTAALSLLSLIERPAVTGVVRRAHPLQQGLLKFLATLIAGHLVNPKVELTCCGPLETLLLGHYTESPVFELLRAAMLQRVRAFHIKQLAGHALPGTVGAFSDIGLAQQRSLCQATWRLLGNLLSNSATPSCHSQIPPVVEALHIAMSLPSACSAFLTCCSPGELNSIYQQSLFEGFTKLDVTVQLNVAALYAQLCHIEAASQSNIAQGHKLPLCKVMLQDVQVFDHCLNVIVGKVLRASETKTASSRTQIAFGRFLWRMSQLLDNLPCLPDLTDIGILSRTATQLMQHVLPIHVHGNGVTVSIGCDPIPATHDLDGYVVFPSLLFVTAVCRRWQACSKAGGPANDPRSQARSFLLRAHLVCSTLTDRTLLFLYLRKGLQKEVKTHDTSFADSLERWHILMTAAIADMPSVPSASNPSKHSSKETASKSPGRKPRKTAVASAASAPAQVAFFTSQSQAPVNYDTYVSLYGPQQLAPHFASDVHTSGPCTLMTQQKGWVELGLPKMHAGSLSIVTITGLLATLDSIEDWHAVPAQIYQACVWWLASQAEAWLGMRAADQEGKLYLLPSLEAHITLIGKLAPHHLSTALDKTVACWAGTAMLQLLCVVLSSLEFAHVLSVFQVQASLKPPVPELGQNTYADIPGYTPPQIKKLADSLLQGLANIRKHVEWSNIMVLCQGQWCQPHHATAQEQLGSTLQYLDAHKQLDATELADIKYYYTSLLGMPVATSSDVASPEARKAAAAPTADMQTHATSLQVNQVHPHDDESWKTIGDQLIAEEQQEQAKAAAKKVRKQKQKARKKSISTSAEASQVQPAESRILPDSTPTLAHTNTSADTASPDPAADYQDATCAMAFNNVSPAEAYDLSASPSTPIPFNRRPARMSPLISPPSGVPAAPNNNLSTSSQTLKPALLPLLRPGADASYPAIEAQASGSLVTVRRQLGAPAAAHEVQKAVHADTVASQVAAGVTNHTPSATASPPNKPHCSAELCTAGCIKPHDRCFFGKAMVPAQQARLMNRSTLHNMCCPITQDVLKDPVIAADGYTYERMAIEHWLQQYDESPVTKQLLPHKHAISNFNIRSLLALMQS